MYVNIRRLLLASAACLPLSLSLSGQVHAELTKQEHLPARSFSGAFLAADAARSDNDFGAAAAYYEEALTYDPGNELLERELLLALLTDGQFEAAIPYARRLRDKPEIERISKIVLGIDALRNRSFDESHDALALNTSNDLERLLTGVMQAWTIQGKGDTSQAIEAVTSLQGPEWYGLFTSYHAGLMAEVSGDDATALDYYNLAAADEAGGGASPLTYLRISAARARLLARLGEMDKAREAIDAGLRLAPTNPALLTLLDGLNLPENKKPLVGSTQAGAAEVLLNLGSAINRDGAEGFAALYLEMARALAPQEANVLFELGSIAERMRRPEKAIEYYALVPENSALRRVAALQQGLNLADLGETEDAISTLKELVEANKSDYRGYLALGGVYASEERFEEAAQTYEVALENIDNEEPTYWPLHYRLGIAYERTKQWPKAEERFLYTLKLSPDQPDVLNYLGYSWVDMNMNLDQGLDMIRKAVELRPRSGYIVDSLGWAYYRLGNFEDAVTELEKAADLLPRDPTITDHLGDAYWRVGRRLEATYQWSTALAFEPEEKLKGEIMAKIAAANLSGETPAIAESMVDSGNAAASTKTDGDDG